MNKNPWLYQTGQNWKMGLFNFLIFISLCLFGILVWRINYREALTSIIPSQGTLSLAFVSIGALAITWLWFSIRCPKCKISIGSYLMTKSDALSFFNDLSKLHRCPNCGFDGLKEKGDEKGTDSDGSAQNHTSAP